MTKSWENKELEVLVVQRWHTHQNEAMTFFFQPARSFLGLRAPVRAPRAISVPRTKFPTFSTMPLGLRIWVYLMSAFQFNSISADTSTQCRHFGGYVIIIRYFNQILRKFEIFNFLQKFAKFDVLHFGLRARKNGDFEAS